MSEAASEKKEKKSWFKGLKSEFKKIIWPDKATTARQTATVVIISAVLTVIILLADWIISFGFGFIFPAGQGDDMAEANWYVVHTYSGYENKVKANIEKTIENRNLQDQILEVTVPMQDMVEMKNGAKKQVSKKMFPGYVLIPMIMHDDTWFVVRNTRGVTGFVGPGSKPVPLTEEEMKPLGINAPEIVFDLNMGDTVIVTSGVWENTVGVIKAVNHSKQSVTISVDMFGRETPVEISFTEVKKMEF